MGCHEAPASHWCVRALAAPSKAHVGPRRRPPPYFHPFGVALQQGPWTTGVKIALAVALFHDFGVARQGPWNTWVNRGKGKDPRDGLGKQRTPRSYAPMLAQSIQQEGVQPAHSRAQTGDLPASSASPRLGADPTSTLRAAYQPESQGRPQALRRTVLHFAGRGPSPASRVTLEPSR